jgi:uncharacterized protein (TIGR03435 family)
MKSGIALLLALFAALAQNPLREFEVASVKPAATNRLVHAAVDSKGFRMTAFLADLVLWAYEIHDYQISEGPSWAYRNYYEIEGRTQELATPKDMRLMVQSLLAKRFQLKLHRQTSGL